MEALLQIPMHKERRLRLLSLLTSTEGMVGTPQPKFP